MNAMVKIPQLFMYEACNDIIHVSKFSFFLSRPIFNLNYLIPVIATTL